MSPKKTIWRCSWQVRNGPSPLAQTRISARDLPTKRKPPIPPILPKLPKLPRPRRPEFTWLDQQNHLVADAEVRADFTDEETAALAEAEERIERASAQLDTFDSDLDAAGRRELWDIVTREQARYAEIERDRADPKTGVLGRFRATLEDL